MLSNQFEMSVIKGQLDLLKPGVSLSCQIDVSSGGGLIPAQAVKLVDNAGGVPKVVEAAADTDDIFGFIGYDFIHQEFNNYDRVEVAREGAVMYMEASAAIARGAEVAIVVSGSKVVTATSAMRVIGRAIDKASASGDLIRVEIGGSAMKVAS